MKVLIRDKIVETYKFPLSEALTFSILVWTMWGFAETFYWQRFLPFFDRDAIRVSPFLYIASFFIYLTIAAVVAVLIYSIIRWILFTMDREESPVFRSATLSGILIVFFLAVGYYGIRKYLFGPSVSGPLKYGVAAILFCFTIFLIFLLYRSASEVGFRLRRSGTTMLSIFILSVVLSFVSFPLFSSEPESAGSSQSSLDLKASIQKLMAYHLVSPAADEESR